MTKQCGSRQRCWLHKTVNALHATELFALTRLDFVNLTSPENKNHNPDTQGPTQFNIQFHLYEVPDVVKLRDRSRRALAGRAGAGEGWGEDGERVFGGDSVSAGQGREFWRWVAVTFAPPVNILRTTHTYRWLEG